MQYMQEPYNFHGSKYERRMTSRETKEMRMHAYMLYTWRMIKVIEWIKDRFPQYRPPVSAEW